MTPPKCCTLALALIASCSSAPGPGYKASNPLVLPDDGPLVWTSGQRLPSGDHLLPPFGADGLEGALLLEGLADEVVDLSRLRLRGTRKGTDLHRNEGFGIVIRNCRDLTVRGGELGGYRVCIAVRDSQRVTIENVSFDGWYGDRLRSTTAAQDPSDWLWPHFNDNDEWMLRYGAAISFTDCSEVTVRGCRGRHGQNGILLSRTTDSAVYDNDFSFLSGWGCALYRSSHNTIAHNIFDYCVRGYSHGVYSVGQDSAGILLFEQSCDNVVARNSATHSGDGIFLYAGHDLVEGVARERGETEVGGSDRNLFFGNDLRHAVANGFEGTFSTRNLVIRNDLSGCAQHGVWGGYSNELLVLKNRINDTPGGGVTIEHGQDCVIAENTFHDDDVGVELYWDSDPELVDGPYGEQRDTDSHDHWIISNFFDRNTQDVVLKETERVRFFDNDWGKSGRRPYIDRLTADGEPDLDLETIRGWMADRTGALPTGHIARTSLSEWVGRFPELLDEYGRYRGPQVPGAQMVRAAERGVPDGDRSTIVMGEWGPWDYRSREPRPEQRQPGGLLADVRWDATWFRWSPENSDPRGDLQSWRALAERPVLQKNIPHVTDPWSDDDVRAVVGVNHFGLIARTQHSVEGGRYQLSVISDDGVRVMVDGETVFEDWTWHATRRDQVQIELEPGLRSFTLEYFQIDGATALSVDLERMEE